MLDGLECLSDKGGDLSSGLRDWLPEKLPPGCSVILGVGDTKSTGFMVLKRVKSQAQPSFKSQTDQVSGQLSTTWHAPAACSDTLLLNGY